MDEGTIRELTDAYKGRKVFVTGHTGFKGSWLCECLLYLGADVYGYALEPNTSPALFDLLKLEKRMHSFIGDIRDYKKLHETIEKIAPDYIFHLAAQPLVRESYRIPRDTYEINVMGTVNLLEAVRQLNIPCSIVNVTTDKVYENAENADYAFVEADRLNGYDPYSNSKSCSELVTDSYMKSFWKESMEILISTVRAGNVIGGGDFSLDRIIPDCVRATVEGRPIEIRNPGSVRPYQHVLEPLFVYLKLAALQKSNIFYSGNYNVGPDVNDCVTTRQLADMFVNIWSGARWVNCEETTAPHEATYLKLDCSKLKKMLCWNAKWGIGEAIEKTVEWYREWAEDKDLQKITLKQIQTFFDE